MRITEQIRKRRPAECHPKSQGVPGAPGGGNRFLPDSLRLLRESRSEAGDTEEMAEEQIIVVQAGDLHAFAKRFTGDVHIERTPGHRSAGQKQAASGPKSKS